jgi:hypothetical protein
MDDGAQIEIRGDGVGEVPDDDDEDGPTMETADAELMLLSDQRRVVMATVDDSIRSKIGKQKRKHRSSDRRRKILLGGRSTDRRMNPSTGGAAPGGDHGDGPPWERHGAEHERRLGKRSCRADTM